MATLLTAGVGLAAAGWLLQPLETPVWAAIRRRQPALRAESTRGMIGPSMTLGVLGGFRTVAADLLWIELQTAWEERDRPAVEALLDLVGSVDPQPLYFWLNGAHILAFDLPTWSRGESGARGRSRPGRRQVAMAGARQALEYLDRALRFHEASPALWIERGNIELNGLGDVEAAAESYHRASELPGAPWYAARLHAELLRRAGRKAEAYAWLRKLLPRLPADDPAAGAAIVLWRIRELERELGVDAAQAYPAAERAHRESHPNEASTGTGDATMAPVLNRGR